MADPRQVGPQARRNNHSPLMQALSKRSEGEQVNFCPFGCEDHELDDKGACHHLVGYTNGGVTYEPRVRDHTGRIFVDGTKREPLKRGSHRLVKITTSARVYDKAGKDELIVTRNVEDEFTREMGERERAIMEEAEALKNPVLDGEWAGTIYDAVDPEAELEAAATGKKKKQKQAAE